MLVLALLAVFVLGASGVSSAQEEGSADTATTVTTAGFPPGDEPAVVVPAGAADDEEPAWTFRYLVPTLLVVTGLALVALIVRYGLGVKGRYRVAR
jgi:hypothetical protein